MSEQSVILSNFIQQQVPDGYIPPLSRQYMSIFIDRAINVIFFHHGKPTTDLYNYLKENPRTSSLIEQKMIKAKDMTIADYHTLYALLQDDWIIAANEIHGINVFTPWALELIRDTNEVGRGFLATLTDPPKERLSIVVLFHEQRYIHKMTEELMVGVLLILDDKQEWKFYLKNVIDAQIKDPIQIKLKDIVINYLPKDPRYNQTTKYNAIINGQQYFFNTLQLLQGVITATRWLGIDPHIFITEIRQENRLFNF